MSFNMILEQTRIVLVLTFNQKYHIFHHKFMEGGGDAKQPNPPPIHTHQYQTEIAFQNSIFFFPQSI